MTGASFVLGFSSDPLALETSRSGCGFARKPRAKWLLAGCSVCHILTDAIRIRLKHMVSSNTEMRRFMAIGAFAAWTGMPSRHPYTPNHRWSVTEMVVSMVVFKQYASVISLRKLSGGSEHSCRARNRTRETRRWPTTCAASGTRSRRSRLRSSRSIKVIVEHPQSHDRICAAPTDQKGQQATGMTDDSPARGRRDHLGTEITRSHLAPAISMDTGWFSRSSTRVPASMTRSQHSVTPKGHTTIDLACLVTGSIIARRRYRG